MPIVRVCFVCLGNICRSPTAEAVFARDVARAGLGALVEIDSAGTGDWHVGQSAHPDTRRTAASRGVTITHRARQFRTADFDAFDLVVVMDASNRRNVLSLARGPDDHAKVRMFRAFEAGASPDADVPDPYHDGRFEEVFDICERASAGLLDHLVAAHRLTPR